jgi:hypothetical protein
MYVILGASLVNRALAWPGVQATLLFIGITYYCKTFYGDMLALMKHLTNFLESLFG